MVLISIVPDVAFMVSISPLNNLVSLGVILRVLSVPMSVSSIEIVVSDKMNPFNENLFDFDLTDIDGATTDLRKYSGKKRPCRDIFRDKNRAIVKKTVGVIYLDSVLNL